MRICDSSESVMSNIAEGFGRGTQGEFVQFLGYALGSLDETRSHLRAAYDREYIEKNDYAAALHAFLTQTGVGYGPGFFASGLPKNPVPQP